MRRVKDTVRLWEELLLSVRARKRSHVYLGGYQVRIYATAVC
jgi:hypothetical protein